MTATTLSQMAQQIERIRAMRAALRAEMQQIQQAATHDVKRSAFRINQTTQTTR